MKNLLHSLSMGLISPIYLFQGEEPLLMEQALQQLSQLVILPGQEWNKETYHGADISPDDIVMSASSGGLMGSRRLIIVKNIPWFKRGAKKTAADESIDIEQLISYAADPNPDTVLVLLLEGSLPKNSRLLKAINLGGRVATFPLIKGGEKERWLKDYFHSQAKQPEPKVISYLALISGEGLLAAKAEADKLMLYSGNNTEITMADAKEIISRSSLAGVFDLTDLLAAKKGGQAVIHLRRLLLQGEAPQKLLAMLGTQMRNTLAVKDLLRRGYSSREAAAKMSINPYVAQKCSLQAKNYSNRELSRALELLLNADIAQKRGEGDLKDLLEVAILRICSS